MERLFQACWTAHLGCCRAVGQSTNILETIPLARRGSGASGRAHKPCTCPLYIYPCPCLVVVWARRPSFLSGVQHMVAPDSFAAYVAYLLSAPPQTDDAAIADAYHRGDPSAVRTVEAVWAVNRARVDATRRLAARFCRRRPPFVAVSPRRPTRVAARACVASVRGSIMHGRGALHAAAAGPITRRRPSQQHIGSCRIIPRICGPWRRTTATRLTSTPKGHGSNACVLRARGWRTSREKPSPCAAARREVYIYVNATQFP